MKTATESLYRFCRGYISREIASCSSSVTSFEFNGVKKKIVWASDDPDLKRTIVRLNRVEGYIEHGSRLFDVQKDFAIVALLWICMADDGQGRIELDSKVIELLGENKYQFVDKVGFYTAFSYNLSFGNQQTGLERCRNMEKLLSLSDEQTIKGVHGALVLYLKSEYEENTEFQLQEHCIVVTGQDGRGYIKNVALRNIAAMEAIGIQVLTDLGYSDPDVTIRVDFARIY